LYVTIFTIPAARELRLSRARADSSGTLGDEIAGGSR
jgi:hypothetical protein